MSEVFYYRISDKSGWGHDNSGVPIPVFVRLEFDHISQVPEIADVAGILNCNQMHLTQITREEYVAEMGDEDE